MCVLFGSVNINIKRVQNAHGLVRNMEPCFMQLLADFSPQKKRNGRVGSEHVEVNLTQIYSSRHRRIFSVPGRALFWNHVSIVFISCWYSYPHLRTTAVKYEAAFH